MNWWVLWQPYANPNYVIFHGSKTQADAKSRLIEGSRVDGPYSSQTAAASAVSSGTIKPPSNQPLGGMGGVGVGAANTVSSWFTSMGGYIGSGIEAGFAALLSDLWLVIIGPLEIIAGAVLAIIVLMWIFKDDIAALARVM